MRNFKLVGVSTSVLAMLALAGCHQDPPRLVDAHIDQDGGRDAASLVDTNVPPVDMGVMTDTGGPTGTCTYGGGCDLTDTASCPNDASGARQGCYPDDTAPGCHPAGTATAGSSCAAANDCDAGNVCLGTGFCARLCCSAGDCSVGESCNPLNNSMGMTLPNHAGVCVRPTACSPLPESGCTTGNHCYVTGADGSTDCVPQGTATEGMTCGGAAAACQSGLGCYTLSSGTPNFLCYRYCRMSMGNTDCTDAAHPTCHGAGLGTMFGICDT